MGQQSVIIRILCFIYIVIFSLNAFPSLDNEPQTTNKPWNAQIHFYLPFHYFDGDYNYLIGMGGGAVTGEYKEFIQIEVGALMHKDLLDIMSGAVFFLRSGLMPKIYDSRQQDKGGNVLQLGALLGYSQISMRDQRESHPETQKQKRLICGAAFRSTFWSAKGAGFNMQLVLSMAYRLNDSEECEENKVRERFDFIPEITVGFTI